MHEVPLVDRERDIKAKVEFIFWKKYGYFSDDGFVKTARSHKSAESSVKLLLK
jgi:hypothetical protein